ncbi:hypothetical protein V6N11_078991 [Hibiscus sabdariffa]|uniref:Uncharacterized protein n=1 Tax=Hibiscus sabdariffa TaxID=183260 RepID=A0ABR2RU32_9ROSI
MALSAVSSAVQTIGKLLAEEAIYLWGVEEQVDCLQTELKWMQIFLRKMYAKPTLAKDEMVRLWVSEIRELAYDAEDVIEDFALRIGSKTKDEGCLSNCIRKSGRILKCGRRLHKTRSKIDKIFTRITDLVRRLQAYDIKELREEEGPSTAAERRESRRPSPRIVDHNIVGLDIYVEQLVSVIVDGESEYKCKKAIKRKLSAMAWSAVSSAVQTIGKLLAQEAIYLWGVEEQVDRLQTELKRMQSSLIEADAKQSNDRRIRLWVAEIRELAYDAEDVIEDFALRTGSRRRGRLSNCNERSTCILKDKRMLQETRSKIDRIFTRIIDLVRQLQAYGINESREGEGPSTLAERRELRQPYPHIIDDDIVGLDTDVKKLVSVIVDEESESRVVSICGIVILDDIWSNEAWDSIKPAFPGKETRTKILLTSRNTEIVSHADSRGYLYQLQCLNQKQSWELFHKIAFSRASIDFEIQVDRLIQLWVAEGIVLSKEEDEDEGSMTEDSATRYLIELIDRCMLQVRERDVTNSKIKTVQMHDLMRDLCLSKAEQENFLRVVDQSNASSISTVGRIHRVSAPNFSWIKHIKSPNLRSFLFFGEISEESLKQVEGLRKPLLREMFRYMENHQDGNENRCLVYLIAAFFILFVVIPAYHGLYAYMFNNFKFLRVFSYEGKGFSGILGCKLSSDIGNLIHLRFLSLRGLRVLWPILPSSLGNLRCLQTLDLRIDRATFLPDVIWRMEQLRHLYLPQVCEVRTKLKLGTLRNLRTLVNFNTESCYLKDLMDMTNLRELEIRGPFRIKDFNAEDLQENPPIIQSKYLHSLSIFNGDGRIDAGHLNHLLSSCVSISKLSLDVEMSELPEYDYLSSDLVYMRLERCKLEEDPMPKLEKLPNLRALELHQKAFTGEKMLCSAQGFAKLESLSLQDLSHLGEWRVDEGAMPCLRRLNIESCRRLKMLPDGLRFITTLQQLKIERMPNAFKQSLKEGGEDFNKVLHVPSITFKG